MLYGTMTHASFSQPTLMAMDGMRTFSPTGKQRKNPACPPRLSDHGLATAPMFGFSLPNQFRQY
jgi:hypothetical protein